MNSIHQDDPRRTSVDQPSKLLTESTGTRLVFDGKDHRGVDKRTGASHRVCDCDCRGRSAEILAQAGELEARFGEDLEPRAAAAALSCGVVLPFFLAACVVGLALAVGVWAHEHFRVVGSVVMR